MSLTTTILKSDPVAGRHTELIKLSLKAGAFLVVEVEGGERKRSRSHRDLQLALDDYNQRVKNHAEVGRMFS